MESKRPQGRDAAVESLLAKSAISDALARYARGVDRVDAELIRSAFWPDAHDAHGAMNGSPEEFIAWFVPDQGEREVAQHFLMNQLVELCGDQADVETYFISVAKRYGQDKVEMVGGRYIDVFEQRRGEWRIKDRMVLLDWQSWGDAATMAERLSRSHRGSRSADDPSYPTA